MSAIYMAVNSWTGTLGCGGIVKAEPPRRPSSHEIELRELSCARQAVEKRIGKRRCRDLHDDEVLAMFDKLHR